MTSVTRKNGRPENIRIKNVYSEISDIHNV